MQQLNNDMDDLFRKAAENYPLDTTGADWNRIQKGLQSEGMHIREKEPDRRRFLLLLLLLPVAIFGYFLFDNKGGIPTNYVAEQNQLQPTDGVTRLANENKTVESSKTSNKTATTTDVHQKPVLEKRETVDRPITQVVPEKTNQGNVVLVKQENDLVIFTEPPVSSPEQFQNNYIRDRLLTSDRGINAVIDLGEKKPVRTGNLQFPVLNQDHDPANKRFYAGLYSGVDATSIKFQDIEGAGYDFGLLVGYNFYKRWSIEASVSYVKKIYYSDGKYFNTDRVYVPANSKITQVEGDCEMIEIPVAVKYNFKSNKKSSVFGTAGVTSYLMKQESYESTYFYPNANPPYSRPYYRKYPNSGNHFISNVLVSGGYTRSLGNIADLRIEPYIKIPLRGVGIGTLPMTSAGVHVGLTKKLF